VLDLKLPLDSEIQSDHYVAAHRSSYQFSEEPRDPWSQLNEAACLSYFPNIPELQPFACASDLLHVAFVGRR
jgi:hypothetical protein